MPKILLTEKFITHQLTCPPDMKRIEYCDTKIPGLFIEVRATSEGQGTYYLRYRDSNSLTKYKKLSRTMDASLAEIRKTAAILRSDLLRGIYPGAARQEKVQCMTFAEFFEQRYLPYATPRKRSIKDDVKLYNKRLKDLFGSTPLDKITRHSLQQMHSDLRATLSASSCDHHLGLTSRCLRLALDWRLIAENPAQGLKKYNEDNRRDRLLTDAELQRLMAVLDSDPARTACLALKMGIFTAARKGEILHMRWSDINRQTNTLAISAQFAKGKRKRMLPLSASALAILDELAIGNTSEWVFLNSRNGERLQSIDKVWQRVRKTADLPPTIVIHSLRHAAASAMLAENVDLGTVRDILGHRDISTTEKYLHTSARSLQSGAAGIEDYMEKALARKAS